MSEPTFRDLSDEWLRLFSAPKHSADWHEKAKYLLRTVLLPKFGALPADEVRQQDIARLLSDIAETGTRVKANHTHAIIRSVFKWGIKRGRIGCPNPVRDIPRPEKIEKRERPLSLHEIPAVWHASIGLGEWGRICRLLILTGCRCTEIGSLVWDEIDLIEHQIKLPRHRTKNRRKHTVHLTALALAQLPERRPGYPNLFGRSIGREFNGWSTGRTLMKRALLGIEPWRLHDLRHTFSTQCNALNLAPPWIIDAALNHVGAYKMGEAGGYNHAEWLPERRALLEAWSAKVGELVGSHGAPSALPALGALPAAAVIADSGGKPRVRVRATGVPAGE